MRAGLDLDGDLDLLVVNGSTIEDEWTLEALLCVSDLKLGHAREGSPDRDVG